MEQRIRVRVEGLPPAAWLATLREKLAELPDGSSVAFSEPVPSSTGLRAADPVVVAAIIGGAAQVLAAVVTAVATIVREHRDAKSKESHQQHATVIVVVEGAHGSRDLQLGPAGGPTPSEMENVLASVGDIRELRALLPR